MEVEEVENAAFVILLNYWSPLTCNFYLSFLFFVGVEEEEEEFELNFEGFMVET